MMVIKRIVQFADLLRRKLEVMIKVEQMHAQYMYISHIISIVKYL